ncbi:RICIN domain-containing protein [Saccharothrix obliqua]|uniref:RICIN domain-containing protein n=1 Tax=Saccharothrix obliqua TaxID=2861747 RepID=UPI001C5F64F4|nr:RICIN domain-containing protein [Saccharothrix obliqua]MBW4718234.1 RICIN domain-containing protein [Saccharothrix obliqua]
MRTRFRAFLVVVAALSLLTAPAAHAAPRPVASPLHPAANAVAGYLIHNAKSGLCADIPGFGPGAPEAPVTQWYCRFGALDNQMWELVSADGVDFVMRNTADGLCMDVHDYGAVEAGALVGEYHCRPGAVDNQVFYLEEVPGGWAIRHRVTGFCLDVTGAAGTGGPDARLTLWPCDPADDHQWNFMV